MRKRFLVLSLVLFTLWLVGVFMFKTPPLIHSVLVMSLISYIRSIMLPGTQPAAYGSSK